MEIQKTDWPAADIITLLFNHHGLILRPFPNRRILDQIAHELVKFRMACMSLLDSAPSDEQYEALGRKSMGTDDEKDREVVAALYAPAKHDTFIADPQILYVPFKLSVLKQNSQNYQGGIVYIWAHLSNY